MTRLMTDYKQPDRKPRTKKDMVAYLTGHPRYHTGNSWNRSTSYSRCIKVNRITFPDKATDNAAWNVVLSQAEWWYASGLKQELEAFDVRWKHRYQLGTNGRSGGYVVIYQGGTEPSGHKSYCTECGQQNYQTAAPEPGQCGRCGEKARVNYAAEPIRVVTYPFKSFDADADFSEWDVESLKDRVELVWDLDETVERMAKKFIEFCRTHTVEEEEILVRKTVQVVRPRS